MSSLVFQRARKEIGLGFNWETQTVRAVVMLKGSWTPAASQEFVSAATGAGATRISAADYDIANPNAFIAGTVEYLGMDAVTATIPGSPGVAFDGLLLFRFVSTDANSWMIGWFDAPGVTNDSGQVIFSPGGGAPLNLF